MRLSIQVTVSDVDPTNERAKQELSSLLKKIADSFNSDARCSNSFNSVPLSSKIEVKEASDGRS